MTASPIPPSNSSATASSSASALKAEPGADIRLCGAAGLAATLVDEIDELAPKMNPIVLGSGIPLFASSIGPRALEVTEFRTYPNGFALLRGRLGAG